VVTRDLPHMDNIDLLTVKQVRWVEGGTQPADDYTPSYGNGNAIVITQGQAIHTQRNHIDS